MDSFGLQRVHSDRVLRDDNTKEVDFWDFELAFFDMEEKLVFSTSLKKSSDVGSVLFGCFMMSVLVVHVDLKPLFKKEIRKGVIHKALEGWGRVA